MKYSVYSVISAFVIIILSLASGGKAMAQATIVPTQNFSSTSDLQIRIVQTHLPRESPAAPATESSTWMASAANWKSVNFNGLQSAGSGFTLAERFTAIDYSKMVTTTDAQSWNGLPHDIPGNNQFGNRAHMALQISAMKTGVTFKMQAIQVFIKSYVFDTLANRWRLDGVIVAFTTLESLNYFRIRCDSAGPAGFEGDLVSSVQDSTIPSVSCYFGGIGIGIGAYGSGTTAQKIQNAINYMVSNHFVVEVNVAVPYDDNGASKMASANHVFVPAGLQNSTVDPSAAKSPLPFGFKPGRTDALRLGESAGTFTTSSSSLYMLQKSRDMQSWTNAGSVARFGSAGFLDFPIEDMAHGEAHYFYRVLTVCPTTLTPLAAPNAGKNNKQLALPEGLPVGDVTLL